MIIEYRSWSNEKITLAEKDLLGQFKIVHINEVDGSIKRIDSILNKKVDSVRYYINEDEIEADIVYSLSSESGNVVIVGTEGINSLKFNIHREYRNGELKFKTKVLYDNRDNMICFQPIDIINNQIIHSETEKYYYIKNDYEILHATYKKDGSLEYAMYMPTYDEQSWESYTFDTLNRLEIITGFNLDYYLNSNIV